MKVTRSLEVDKDLTGYLLISYDTEISHKIRDNPEFKLFVADLGKRTTEMIIKESFKYEVKE
jgi:hypothetical protein